MTTKKLPPRDVPDRDSKYMAMAVMYAGLSKDPHTQVGALVISQDNIPIGWGYNGPPANIKDEEIDWNRPAKYDYIDHAEENALDLAYYYGSEDAIIYVSGLPCKKCMRKIVKNKLKRVCYLDRKYDDNSMFCNEADIAIVHDIAKKGGVSVDKFTGNVNWITDWISQLKKIGVLTN